MSKNTFKTWLSSTFGSSTPAKKNFVYAYKAHNDDSFEREQYRHHQLMHNDIYKQDWATVQQIHRRAMEKSINKEKLKKIQDDKNLIEELIRKYAHGAYEISVIDLLNEVNELDEKSAKITKSLQ